MIIGVPKEIKDKEFRIAIIPQEFKILLIQAIRLSLNLEPGLEAPYSMKSSQVQVPGL